MAFQNFSFPQVVRDLALTLANANLFASIAESVASVGTAFELLERGMTASGMSNHTTFLRAVTAGTVHAVGRPLTRGRPSWVWGCKMTADHEALGAPSTVPRAARHREPRRDPDPHRTPRPAHVLHQR